MRARIQSNTSILCFILKYWCPWGNWLGLTAWMIDLAMISLVRCYWLQRYCSLHQLQNSIEWNRTHRNLHAIVLLKGLIVRDVCFNVQVFRWIFQCARYLLTLYLASWYFQHTIDITISQSNALLKNTVRTMLSLLYFYMVTAIIIICHHIVLVLYIYHFIAVLV